MGNTISYTVKEHALDLGAKGIINGLQFDEKARRYAGIPYALPPTGEYRWQRPRPLPRSFRYANDDGMPYDAREFKPPCRQGVQISGNHKPGGSEDCLFMNIWTPVETTDEKGKLWPVMIWIHGGWFQIGNPSQDNDMDPTELISTGRLRAIVVAVGYRLNIFGFLAGSALAEESDGRSCGNFGLWDQRLAIEWVYDNIKDFGGDVGNITLAGRSAGSYSVEAQVLHEFRAQHDKPPETIPFHRIFMSSNAIPAQPKTVAEAEPQFEEVCEYFKIPLELAAKEKLSRLRGVNEDDLVSALSRLEHHTFRPVTDELFFHAGMVNYFRNGNFAREFRKRGMKVLIGEVLNEDTLYAQYNSPRQSGLDELRLQVSNYYASATTEEILKQYELPITAQVTDWKTLFGNIIADGQVRAPTRCFVEDLHRFGVPMTSIWRYRIGYRLSFIDEAVAPMSYGVTHSMDKSFWNFSITHGPTDKEKELMQSWIQILVAFVHDDENYEFGTGAIDEFKTVTPSGKIVITHDDSYNKLKDLGDIIACV
ncbi:Alpha/Beta hydrolase protein [Thelonectria olida]|uniref:Carboxylic ester hydrolase n=1 Tax=Thelonectria olida TaxID=1576542 RepID=A0A9P9AH59_9HYPO|nr:Alpha/Beta hydrolase protein [Thelonectria olida]